MKINIIAAIGKNNEIGLDNKLLWKSKSDLEHFKELTLGKPIIMGRKTFESLPGILPGRTHLVVTSQASALCFDKSKQIPQVVYTVDLQRALESAELFEDTDEVFIIGGASIYEQALPLADELHISHMDWEGEADTYFPEIGPEWSASTNGKYAGEDGPDWQYLRYTKDKLSKTL